MAMARPTNPPADALLETPRRTGGLHGLYERLVSDHAGDLFRMARRFVGDGATAEDLIQDTFLEAWRSLRSLRDPAAGRAWLHAILRHRFARWARRRRNRPQTGVTDEVLDSGRGDPGPDVLERLADRDAVERALAALPDPQREALVLMFVEGLSSHEAAARLAIPRGTILSRVHRARRTLRVVLRRGAGGGV